MESIHMYILSEFDNFEKIHTKKNFSNIYIATHIRTKEKVILKLYLESIKNNIYEYLSKELLINKYLTENTYITMKLKGICLDDSKDLLFLVIEYGDYSLYDYMKNTEYSIKDVEKIFYEGAKLLFIIESKYEYGLSFFFGFLFHSFQFRFKSCLFFQLFPIHDFFFKSV